MSASVHLSNLARALLLPPFGQIFLCALGLVLRRQLPRLGMTISWGALALLFLLSTDIGVRLLVNPLEQMASPLDSAVNAKARAIVVLTAGRLRDAPEYGGRDMPDYVALARMEYAAKLHRETGLPVLTTGGSPGTPREPEASIMARSFRDSFSIPVQWIEGRSVNTAENAFFSAAILRNAGIKRVLLVTDAMHMPRAHAMFALAGIEALAAPTVFLSSRRDISLTSFSPNVESLRRVHYALYEWIGIGWYHVRYRMPLPSSPMKTSTVREPGEE